MSRQEIDDYWPPQILLLSVNRHAFLGKTVEWFPVNFFTIWN